MTTNPDDDARFAEDCEARRRELELEQHPTIAQRLHQRADQVEAAITAHVAAEGRPVPALKLAAWREAMELDRAAADALERAIPPLELGWQWIRMADEYAAKLHTERGLELTFTPGTRVRLSLSDDHDLVVTILEGDTPVEPA